MTCNKIFSYSTKPNFTEFIDVLPSKDPPITFWDLNYVMVLKTIYVLSFTIVSEVHRVNKTLNIPDIKR